MDNDFEPSTPVVNEHSKRSKDDLNEILLGNDEVSEDETADDMFDTTEEDDDA